MAFFDKLKNAAEKAKEVAAKAAATASGIAEQVKEKQQAREQEQQAQSEALWEAKRKAYAAGRQDILERLQNTPLDQELDQEDISKYEELMGDDEDAGRLLDEFMRKRDRDVASYKREIRIKAWEENGFFEELLSECACTQGNDGCYCTACPGTFFATCERDVECPRKQKHLESGSYTELLFPDTFCYAARLAALHEGGPALQKDSFADVTGDFLEAYIPHFAGYYKQLAELIEFHGVGKDNYRLALLYYMGHCPEKMHSGALRVLLDVLEAPPVAAASAMIYYQNVSHLLDTDALYNIDLEDEELEYLFKLFDIISNPERLAKQFECPEVVSYNDLYKANGELKEIGLALQERDNFDTVYGVVNYWENKSKRKAERNS